MLTLVSYLPAVYTAFSETVGHQDIQLGYSTQNAGTDVAAVGSEALTEEFGSTNSGDNDNFYGYTSQAASNEYGNTGMGTGPNQVTGTGSYYDFRDTLSSGNRTSTFYSTGISQVGNDYAFNGITPTFDTDYTGPPFDPNTTHGTTIQGSSEDTRDPPLIYGSDTTSTSGVTFYGDSTIVSDTVTTVITGTHFGTSSTSTTAASTTDTISTTVSTYDAGGYLSSLIPGTIPTTTIVSDYATTVVTNCTATLTSYSFDPTDTNNENPVTFETTEFTSTSVSWGQMCITGENLGDSTTISYDPTDTDFINPITYTVTSSGFSVAGSGTDTSTVEVDYTVTVNTYATSQSLAPVTVLIPENTPTKNDWGWIFAPASAIGGFVGSDYSKWDHFFTSFNDWLTIPSMAFSSVDTGQPDFVFTGQTGTTAIFESGSGYTNTTGGSRSVLSGTTAVGTSYNWFANVLPMPSTTFVSGYQYWTTEDADLWVSTSFSSSYTADLGAVGGTITFSDYSIDTTVTTYFTTWLLSDGGLSWTIISETDTTRPLPATIQRSQVVGFNQTISSFFDETTATTPFHQQEYFYLTASSGSTATGIYDPGLDMIQLTASLFQFTSFFTAGFQFPPFLDDETDAVYPGVDTVFLGVAGGSVPYPYYLNQDLAAAGSLVSAFFGTVYSNPTITFPQVGFPQTIGSGIGTFVTYTTSSTASLTYTYQSGSAPTDITSSSFTYLSGSDGTFYSVSWDVADSSAAVVGHDTFFMTSFSTSSSINSNGVTVTLTSPPSTWSNIVSGFATTADRAPIVTGGGLNPTGQYASEFHIGGKPRGFGEKTLFIRGCFDITDMSNNTATEMEQDFTMTILSTGDMMSALGSQSAYNCASGQGGPDYRLMVFDKYYPVGGGSFT